MNNKNIIVNRQIFETYDYDIFHFIDENREIDIANKAKIKKSFKRKALLVPIWVNSEYGIVDGQHRYEIRKELGLPIIFYIDDDYEDEDLANAQISSSWKNKDYLNKGVKQKNENYLWYSNFCKKHGMVLGNAEKILIACSNESQDKIRNDLKNGSLVITKEVRESMDEVVEALEDFSFFSCYKSSSFISAFVKLYFYDKYNHMTMKSKLRSRGNSIKKMSSWKDYLDLLTEQVYNFKTVNKIYYNVSEKTFYTL